MKKNKYNNKINSYQANSLKINKQELSTNDYLEFNNKIIEKTNEIPKFEKNKDLILDQYFIKDNDFYFLEQNNNIPKKISGIENIKILFREKIIFKDKKIIYILGQIKVYIH